MQKFFKNNEHFSQKLFKGLEFKKKEEVKKFEMGDKGIAIKYNKITDN